MDQRVFIGLARVAAVAFLLTVASVGVGQTTADKEQAKALVVAGRALRDDQHDHEGALERFRAAYGLIKTPIIGLDLAGEYEALFKLVEAYGICDEIGRLPVKETESEESKQARVKAAEFGVALRARMPKLSFTLRGKSAHRAGPTVWLDGEILPPESLLVPRVVNPGEHEVVVRVRGAVPTRTMVTAVEGKTQEIVLDVPVARDKELKKELNKELKKELNIAGPIRGVSHREAKPAGSALSTVGLVAAATGVVTLGVGGVMALLAKSRANATECDERSVCATPADLEQRHAAVKEANLATGFVVVGGVLAAGGAVVWLAAPREKASVARRGGVRVGLGLSGVLVRGKF